MPRADRLVELVHLLGGRPRRLEDLVRHFERSERTIYRDLAHLSRRFPIARNETGYQLVEGSHFRPLNLTGAELAVLRLALDNPPLRSNPSLARRLATLEAKLNRAAAAAAETPAALALATLDRTGPMPPKLLERLEEAIAGRRRVRVDYRSLTRARRRRRGLDPYRVFHRGDAWYVVGRCHVHDEPRTFRLDRIADIRLLEETFELPADFSLDAYLADSWSVFRGRSTHDVILRFDPALAPLLEAARHHPSERVQRLADGTLEYRARVSHLDEIARWVLGFGGRCRVMAPGALRRHVVELAKGVVRSAAVKESTRQQERRRSRRGSETSQPENRGGSLKGT